LGEGAGLVRKAVRELVDAGSREILLNLHGVTYVDSSGLGEMAGSYATVATLGGQLKLVHSQARIDKLLQVTKLCALLETFDDEAAALLSFEK